MAEGGKEALSVDANIVDFFELTPSRSAPGKSARVLRERIMENEILRKTAKVTHEKSISRLPSLPEEFSAKMMTKTSVVFRSQLHSRLC
jgi:hypothetical protein